MRKVLSIAGSDSGGGAGIQADLKTISALGAYGMTAITAITAQNTYEITSVVPLAGKLVAAQIRAILEDMGADSIKIGMLYNEEIVLAVSKCLEEYREIPIVLDPVMISHSGNILLVPEAVGFVLEKLLPLTEVFTPNIPEAIYISGEQIDTLEDMERVAKLLANLGCTAVLLKGGHLEGRQRVDVLYLGKSDTYHHFSTDTVESQNTHGTGCTLSSAIAVGLARGLSIERAVGNAKQYVYYSLVGGVSLGIGKGKGPLHHFFEGHSAL